jgi:hypothetical protein
MDNFLKNRDLQERLREQVAIAKKNIEQLKQRGQHALGDSYFFMESRDLPVRWVSILQHVDNRSLWYLVAADDYPGVGSCDVELPPKHEWAPMVLRCGVGFWAHERDLKPGNYAGRLVGDPLDDARLRLSEMVHGTVPMPASDLATDEDPDYCDWMEELSSVAERIELRLQSEPIVVAAPANSKSWVGDLVARLRNSGDRWKSQVDGLMGGADLGFQPALAANPTGQPPQPTSLPDGFVLTTLLPGTLVLLKDDGDYELVYYPDQDEKPQVRIDSSGVDDKHQWICGPDGVCHWSEPIRAVDGKMVFYIDEVFFSVAAF